jgi:hypothetical protein
MSKLITYRVSYRIVQTYQIDVDASTPDHAAAWAQTLLDRFGGAIHGSKSLRCDGSVSDVRLSGPLSSISLPVA